MVSTCTKTPGTVHGNTSLASYVLAYQMYYILRTCILHQHVVIHIYASDNYYLIQTDIGKNYVISNSRRYLIAHALAEEATEG